MRTGLEMPRGQGTPLLKSLGIATPMISSKRKRQQRRPLLDAHQAFKSTAVKYELKLNATFQAVSKMSKKENLTPF